MSYQIHTTGKNAEAAAAEYLEKCGLKLLEKNFSQKTGEIDLIMDDNGYRVFVEVRCRNNSNYASALESVTRQKQHKIIKTALLYLQKHKLVDKIPCRFDVVGIDFRHGHMIFDWIKDAFIN